MDTGCLRWLAACALAVLGCGGKAEVPDGSAPDAAVPDSGERDSGERDSAVLDGSADGGSVGSSLTVRAVRERFFGVPQPPEPDAEFVLVRQDGSRERAAADANGEATFDVGADEPVSVTAFIAGGEHKLASFVGFTPEQLRRLDGTHLVEDGVPLLPAGPRAERSVLSGTAAGATDDGTLQVAFGDGLSYAFAGADWYAPVRKEVPTTLVAHFYVSDGEPLSPRGLSHLVVGWDVVDLEPVTEDKAVDLAIDSSFPAVTTDGTLPLPTGTPFLESASLDIGVMDADTGVFYGTASRVDIEPGSGRFDFTIESVDVGATRTLTRFHLVGAERESRYWADGLPSGELAAIPFLSPVDPVVPDDGGSVSFSEGVELTAGSPAGVLPLLVYYPEPGPGRGVSRAYYPPGATTLPAPPVPEELGAAPFLGSSASVFVDLCEPVPGVRCRRTATGLPLETVP